MLIANEIWKSIGYDPRYQVSNYGRFRKKNPKNGYRYLKPFRKGNLFQVKIKDKDMNCARLVANAFIKQLSKEDRVYHKNKNGGNMKLKIKKHIKQFIDYTLTDEFKPIVMILLVCFTFCGFLFGVISTALVNETLEVATEQKEKYDKLEAKYEELQSDYNRLEMWSQEVYELFITCQETESWYEKFYYDNVDKYTGEIEGEYYE